jgi:hypothetical protein
MAISVGPGDPDPAVGTWDSSNPRSRKRRLPNRWWLAENYPPSAHNQSMNNHQSCGLLLTTDHCPLTTGYPHPPFNIYFRLWKIADNY